MNGAIIYAIRDTQDVQDACDLLHYADAFWLERHHAPDLYASGVRYHREGPGFEKFLTIPFVLAAGGGDCEDLACWLAAEQDGRPLVIEVPSGWHVVTMFPGGRIEDPSRVLGMGKTG